jgi:hypothetical protein
VDETT